MKKVLLSFMVLLFSMGIAKAQVSQYGFAQSNGTYTEITGGNVVTTSLTSDASSYGNIPLGFSYSFGLGQFTQLCIADDGYVCFTGTGSSSSFFTSSYYNGISAINADLQGNGNGEIRYEVLGLAPNRTFVAQWKNYKRYSYGGTLNFQIRLNETANTSSIVYGNCTSGTTSYAVSVGLKGAANTDFLVRTSATDWTATAAGSSNSDKVTVNGTIAPTAGLTFTYTPPVMTFTTSQATQVAGSAPSGSSIPVIKIEVVSSGISSPLNVTELVVNANGTTNLPDIVSAKVYFTASNNTFSNAVQFGNTVTNLSAPAVITGDVILNPGTNYFWLVYETNSNAPAGNVLDAECTQLTAGGIARTPTVTAPDGVITLVTPLSGDITVGTDGDFANFTEFAATLASNGVGGNINVNIISDIVETATVVFPVPIETGVGGYTITVKPQTLARTISGNISGALIALNGTDRVVFDGRINGEGNNLTFINNGTSSSVINLRGASAGNGCTNIIIRNLNIIGGSISSGNYGILMGNATTGSGYDHDNVQIRNNNISKSYYGIYAYGNAAGIYDNLIIADNQIGSEVLTDVIALKGIAVSNSSAPVISGNTVFNMSTAVSSNKAGIELYEGTVANAQITGNKVRGIRNPNTGGYGSYGIAVSTDNAANALIANNWVSDILTTQYDQGTSFQWTANGIRIAGGNGHKIYYNSVNLYGTNVVNDEDPSVTAALMIHSGTVSGLDVRNNIFINNIEHVFAGIQSFAVYNTSATNNPFAQINNNIYYVNDTYGAVGFTDDTEYSALADWQTAVPADAGSKFTQVDFSSNDDLLITGTSLNNPDMKMPLITGGPSDDITGETRNLDNNFAGADVVTVSIAVTEQPASELNLCKGNTSEISAKAEISFSDGIVRNVDNAIAYTWKKDGDTFTGTVETIVNNNKIIFNNAKIEDNGTYVCEMVSGEMTFISNPSVVSVQEPIVIIENPVNSSACFGGAEFVTLNAQVDGTINNVIWEKEGENGFEPIAGAVSYTLSIPLTSPEAVEGNYRMKITGPGTCGEAVVYTETAAVNITNPITDNVYVYNFDNTNICEKSDLLIRVDYQGTVYNIKWQKNISGIWTDLNSIEFPTCNTSELYIKGAKTDYNGLYRVVLYGSAQCNVPVVEMDPIELTVKPGFEFVKHPANQVICEGNSFILGVVSRGNVSEYAWYKDGVKLNAEGVSTGSEAFLEIKNTDYLSSGSYIAKAKITDCSGTYWVESNPAEVYVLRATQITRQPNNAKAFEGGRAVFTVQAHNKGKLPPFYQDNYQWYRWNNTTKTAVALVDDNIKISGSRSNLLMINNIASSDFNQAGDGVFVIVTGLCSADTSKIVSLTEGASVTITSQPVNNTICEGAPVEFSVAAMASNPSANLVYQWNKDGMPIQGAITEKYQIASATQLDAGNYSVLVSYDNGDAEEISDAAVLSIDMMPIVTVQPDAAITVDNGKELKLTVVADGKAPLAYQWVKDGADIIGAVSAEFVIAASAQSDAGNYSVKISNSCGEVVSSVAVVTVTKTNLSVENNLAGISVSNISPNPSNGSAQIRFDNETAQNVEITLNDASGRKAAELYNGLMSAGNNVIDINTDKLNIASGTYFVVVRTNTGIVTRYFVLVK